MLFKCVLKQIGVKGEAMSLHTDSSSVSWNQGSYVIKKQPLTWYKVRVNTNKTSFNTMQKKTEKLFSFQCSQLLPHQEETNHWP